MHALLCMHDILAIEVCCDHANIGHFEFLYIYIQAFGFLTTFAIIGLIITLIVAFFIEKMKGENNNTVTVNA